MARQFVQRSREQGFTLVFSILLVAIISVLAGTMITRVLVANRAVVNDRAIQNDSDLAVTALNMAFDEVSRNTDLMSNTVWTSQVEDKTSGYTRDGAADTAVAVPPRNLAFPAVEAVAAGTTCPECFNVNDSSGASFTFRLTTTPLRELALLGNIRNWPAFADWSRWGGNTSWDSLPDADRDAWSKGWEYLPEGGYTLRYEMYNGGSGSNTGLNTGEVVKVGSTNTTGTYWYDQMSPRPPASGSADTAPRSWPNINQEYPQGLFHQPMLWKVFTLGSEPRPGGGAAIPRRAAVFVRMSLHDYYSPDSAGVAQNAYIDGKTVFSPRTATFNAANLIKSPNALQAITFSIISVGEGRPLTYSAAGTPLTRAPARRYHQALNVAVGPCEYNSGNSVGNNQATLYNTREKALPLFSNDYGGALRYPAAGSDSPDGKFYDRTSRFRDSSVTPAQNRNQEIFPVLLELLKDYRAPYFAPSFATSGNGRLVMHQPIKGRVFPASLDFRRTRGYSYPWNPTSTSNDRRVLFLYEVVELPGTPVREVVFLIERVQGTVTRWRRRLLRDTSVAAAAATSRHYSVNGEQIQLPMASHSNVINPWDPGLAAEKIYPSLLFVAGKPFIRRDAAGGTAYGPRNCCDAPPVTPTTTPHPGFRGWLRVEPWTAGSVTRLFEVGIPVTASFTGAVQNYAVERRSLDGVEWYDPGDNQLPYEDHWATQSFNPDKITLPNVTTYGDMTYPFTALADEDGFFEVGTTGTTGTTSTTAVENTVNWEENPLVRRNAGGMSINDRLPADMPWEGPTMAWARAVPDIAQQATVSYVLTMYPQYSWSGYWGLQSFRGGGVSLSTEVATLSVNGR
jgi:type II secretory pathway pseudopilin PulG